MLNRAYSLLEVKSVDAERRTFSGMATTPTPDRIGDVIEPLGVQFANPSPLLLFHDRKLPVGLVKFGKPTPKGVPFDASIPDITEPGTLKERADEAWHSVKYGLLKAVSIGFRDFQGFVEALTTGGLRYLKTEVVELSLVSVPMNAEAVITTIKALDAPHLAASGLGAEHVTSPSAGASASRVRVTRSTSMNYAEKIAQNEATRQAKAAELAAIQTKVSDEGRTKDENERQVFDALKADIESIDKEIADLRGMEALSLKAAQPVNGKTPEEAAASRGSNGNSESSRLVVLKQSLPKGTLFTRYAMAVAAGRGSYSDTLAFAKRWDGQTPDVSDYIRRKAVEGTTTDTGSPSWGSQLVYQTNLADEFIELLRAATILGKIQGLRRVPFDTRMVVQIGGSTVNWVGESAVKPVSQLEFDTMTLGFHKAAGIVVLSEELVRRSSPDAEEAVRRDLVEQITRFLDRQFILPTVTASANNPAAITNGIASPAATGTDADALYVDLNTALATFDDAELGTDSLVILMPPALARGISTLRNALGQFEFTGLTRNGGMLLGYPVIVSNSVPSGTIVLINAAEIFIADDGSVRLDASSEATLDMTGGATPTFSLWQRNCVGIRAERGVTWKRRREEAVAIIDTASYGPSVGSP